MADPKQPDRAEKIEPATPDAVKHEQHGWNLVDIAGAATGTAVVAGSAFLAWKYHLNPSETLAAAKGLFRFGEEAEKGTLPFNAWRKLRDSPLNLDRFGAGPTDAFKPSQVMPSLGWLPKLPTGLKATTAEELTQRIPNLTGIGNESTNAFRLDGGLLGQRPGIRRTFELGARGGREVLGSIDNVFQRIEEPMAESVASTLKDSQWTSRMVMRDVAQGRMNHAMQGIEPGAKNMSVYQYLMKYGDDETSVSRFTEYLSARERYEKVVNKTLGEQASMLEKSLNGLSETKRLKPIRIQVATDLDATTNTATYELGKGNIKLSSPLFDRMRNPELADAVGHEISHLEQDKLMIWRLADRAEGEQGLSGGAALNWIKSQYTEKVGAELDNRFLNEILEQRAGAPLHQGAAARADELLDSIKTASESHASLNLLTVRDYAAARAQGALKSQDAKSFLSGVKDPTREGDYSLLREIPDLRALAKKAGSVPSSRLRQQVNRILTSEREDLATQIEQHARQYFTNRAEQEAYHFGHHFRELVEAQLKQ